MFKKILYPTDFSDCCAHAFEYVKRLKGELEEQGLKVRVEIKEGIPFREIIEVADEEGVSLIVIGSHGKSMVREMLLGSVSEKVARKAKQPVLIVKGVKPK